MSLERLDKILSHQGLATRKGVRKLLRVCEVTVNGERVFDAGFSVNCDKDVISIDGEELSVQKNVYFMMNKTQNVVSANKDGMHQTVFDFLDEQYRTPYFEEKLHLVGRLDIDTEGLLLFTTDGAMTHKITSPKTHYPKSYFVRLAHKEDKNSQDKIFTEFKKGIHIAPEANDPEADCKPVEALEWLSDDECVLTITEGKFHQVKRMFKAVGNEVVYLKRLSIGPLKLDETLKPGEYRELTSDEVENLLSFL